MSKRKRRNHRYNNGIISHSSLENKSESQYKQRYNLLDEDDEVGTFRKPFYQNSFINSYLNCDHAKHEKFGIAIPISEKAEAAGGWLRGARGMLLNEKILTESGCTAFFPLATDAFMSASQWEGGYVVGHPMPDYGCWSVTFLKKQAERICKWVDDGHKVIVACTGGHGRTGTVLAACALHWNIGSVMEDPVDWIRSVYCEEAVESIKQENVLYRIAGLPLKEEKKVYSGNMYSGNVYLNNQTYQNIPFGRQTSFAYPSREDDKRIINYPYDSSDKYYEEYIVEMSEETAEEDDKVDQLKTELNQQININSEKRSRELLTKRVVLTPDNRCYNELVWNEKEQRFNLIPILGEEIEEDLNDDHLIVGLR